MAVKRELGIRRQSSEGKEGANAPDPGAAAGKPENIDTLVSSFLAELTDLSSEMKNQVESVETVGTPAGKPETKPGDVKIPKSFQLHEDFSLDPDLEIINDQIEQSLVELESLKSAGLKEEEKIPVSDSSPEPKVAPVAAKAIPAPPMKEQARPPIVPPKPDPEEQAWDRLQIFRDRYSSPVGRHRKTLIVIGAAFLITILALLIYSILTSYESSSATDVAPSVSESSVGKPEQNTVALKMLEPAAAPVSKLEPVSNTAERKAPAASAAKTSRPAPTASNIARPENQEGSGTQSRQADATPSPAQPSSTNLPVAPSPELNTTAATPPVTAPPVVPATTAPANGSAREAASTAPKTELAVNAAAPELAAQPRGRTPVMAEIIARVQPEYPAIARQQKVTGRVEVEADVDEKGVVVRAQAVSGPMLLRGAAEQAVTKWKFKPASIEGVNIPSKARISVNFNLQ